ncbi:MAG: energy-coupling factor transporter transmembrane protein EcfT [Coriobacteriales bacterium]|jgi:energy-coupling factor transporter transmembrane protein EcfT|nr:energy-coupling factor transporter transmembrane protein EcfT [Coriobacteriales bacterium]
MERLYVARPLYPLATIAFSLIVFVTGLLIARLWLFLPWLVALCVLYVCFGYAAVVLRCLAIFVPLGLVCGAVAWLVFGDVAAVWQNSGRVVLLGLCAVPLISTPPSVLTRALGALNCPRIIVLGVLVAVRFIPVLLREMRQIAEAMRTRGVRLVSGASLYRAFLIPLITRIVNISETLSLSLETRGFDLAVRQTSVFVPVRFCLRDGLFCLCALAFVGIAVFAALGVA